MAKKVADTDFAGICMCCFVGTVQKRVENEEVLEKKLRAKLILFKRCTFCSSIFHMTESRLLDTFDIEGVKKNATIQNVYKEEKTFEQHKENLREVFRRLSAAGLK